MLSNLSWRALYAVWLAVFVVITVGKEGNCDEGGNNNKISALLNYIREKSANTVNNVDNPELNEMDLSHLSEQELLDEICSRMRFVMICKKSVETMAKMYPEKLKKIVEALRTKSKDEDARKLLRHKLIEFGLDKADEKGLDETMNTLVDLLVMRSPYGMAANQVVNLASKYIV